MVEFLLAWENKLTIFNAGAAHCHDFIIFCDLIIYKTITLARIVFFYIFCIRKFSKKSLHVFFGKAFKMNQCLGAYIGFMSDPCVLLCPTTDRSTNICWTSATSKIFRRFHIEKTLRNVYCSYEMVSNNLYVTNFLFHI
jgi:hypothetical protein